MSDWVLVIDQGGQSTRVAVFDSSGKLLFQEKSPCVTQTINIDQDLQYIEQNPGEILDGILQSIANIRDQAGDEIKNIKAAGFSGQGSSLLCWNHQTGEALSPVLSWQDVRGKAYLDNMPMSQQQVQQQTGLRFSPHYGASKIRWCLDHIPAVKQALESKHLAAGPIVSFILWHLAGQKKYVDPGHAQRTLLWNIHTCDWDQDLLDLFAIPKTILPQCLFHHDNFGQVFIGNYAIDFRVCARDQGASLFAKGMPDKNTAYINIGTGAFIQRISQDQIPPQGLLVSPLWISHNKTENLFAWEATVNGAAAAISYVEQKSGVQITPAIMEQALSIPLGTADYFINTRGGLGAPFWRTDIESHFSGELSPLQQIACWLESILFLLMVNLHRMNRDKQLTSIQLSGGFSQSLLFCQRLADLSRMTVNVSENPEASLQGIAYLTANRPQNWRLMVESRTFTPKENDLLRKRFDNWLQAMPVV